MMIIKSMIDYIKNRKNDILYLIKNGKIVNESTKIEYDIIDKFYKISVHIVLFLFCLFDIT